MSGIGCEEILPQELVLKILGEADYGFRMKEIAKFICESKAWCTEDFLKHQRERKITLEDIFRVAQETGKPVGLYVQGATHGIQRCVITNDFYDRVFGQMHRIVPVEASYITIFNVSDLSVFTLAILMQRDFESRPPQLIYRSFENRCIYNSIIDLETAVKNELFFFKDYMQEQDDYDEEENKTQENQHYHEEGGETQEEYDEEDQQCNGAGNGLTVKEILEEIEIWKETTDVMKEYVEDPFVTRYVLDKRLSSYNMEYSLKDKVMNFPQRGHTHGLYYIMILMLLDEFEEKNIPAHSQGIEILLREMKLKCLSLLEKM